jgi:hypothetical protein
MLIKLVHNAINEAIEAVKKSGYGEVVVKIQDHKIVYIEKTEGMQVKET